MLNSEKFGVPGNLIAWLTEFFDNRTVWFDVAVSSKRDFLLFVAQGSALESLLFSPFTDDFPLRVHNCHLFLLADFCKI